MSSNELLVLIGDSLAGVVTNRQGSVQFVYDELYQRLPEPTPLSVSMPIERSIHGDQVVSSWMAGLLPDNDRVLVRWARTFQVANTAFALLGTPVGEDCAGAVRFVTAARLDAALTRPGQVEWLDESGVAARLRDLRRDEASWLGAGFTGRFSLAGAQAKTALISDSGRWGVPSGSAATSHILKPAISGFDDHDLNEHLCLRAAQNLGMTVANSSIEQFEDESAVVIERYDRTVSGSGWMSRIHQEDLCQATGRPPGRKYQNEGGAAPAEIALLLRRVMTGRQADDALWRFFDGLALNWLICGTDAHSKNYSLLLSGRQVRLAPLYDVASALPYGLPIQKMRLAMKLGGSYLLTGASEKIWPKVAAELGLPRQTVRERAAALMEALPGAFVDAASESAVQAIGSSLPGRLVDAVSTRVLEAQATL